VSEKQFVCGFCGVNFTREASGKRVYSFCGYSCSVKSRQHAKGKIPTYEQRACVVCDIVKQVRVYASYEKQQRDTVCSKKCSGILAARSRGQDLDAREKRVVDGKAQVKITCQRCQQDAWMPRRGKSYKYCSRSCGAKTNSEQGSGFSSNEARLMYWTKVHGGKEAQQRLNVMTEKKSTNTVARNKLFSLSQASRDKIAVQLQGKTFHPWTGKKLVDCVGEDRAKELIANQSIKTSATMKEAYASGRCKPTGYPIGRHNAHGYSFRSKLELCYANELVASGLQSGVDWEYEPHDLRVAYIGPDGEHHTYFPDFRVLDDIVEVKPISQLKDDFVLAKAIAARIIAEEFGTSFYFVTERDVPSYKMKASRSIAA